MEVSEELEELVDGALTQSNSRLWEVRAGGSTIFLADMRCGSDFVFGTEEGTPVILPIGVISSLSGGAPPPSESLSLSAFLSAQRVPIRIRYLSNGQSHSCWLLNVVEPWLRIGTATGVEWLPIAAMEFARLELDLACGAERSRGGVRW